MTASEQPRARRVAFGGTRVARLCGRSLRLWLGDLEACLFASFPVRYAAQARPGRVLLTPLEANPVLAQGSTWVAVRGHPGQRYVYLGRCREVLGVAGIDPVGESWVHLVYDPTGIVLRPLFVPPRRDVLVRRVQRLRGDGRLWLGCLGALGIEHRRYRAVLHHNSVMLFPSVLSTSSDTIVLRGKNKHRYVYFTHSSHRHILNELGLLSTNGTWVLVDVSLEMICITGVTSGAVLSRKRELL